MPSLSCQTPRRLPLRSWVFLPYPSLTGPPAGAMFPVTPQLTIRRGRMRNISGAKPRGRAPRPHSAAPRPRRGPRSRAAATDSPIPDRPRGTPPLGCAAHRGTSCAGRSRARRYRWCPAPHCTGTSRGHMRLAVRTDARQPPQQLILQVGDLSRCEDVHFHSLHRCTALPAPRRRCATCEASTIFGK